MFCSIITLKRLHLILKKCNVQYHKPLPGYFSYIHHVINPVLLCCTQDITTYCLLSISVWPLDSSTVFLYFWRRRYYSYFKRRLICDQIQIGSLKTTVQNYKAVESFNFQKVRNLNNV